MDGEGCIHLGIDILLQDTVRQHHINFQVKSQLLYEAVNFGDGFWGTARTYWMYVCV